MILACYREYEIGQLVPSKKNHIWIEHERFSNPFVVLREVTFAEWCRFWKDRLGHAPTWFPACKFFYEVSVD